jgi:hypothetical protein
MMADIKGNDKGIFALPNEVRHAILPTCSIHQPRHVRTD